MTTIKEALDAAFNAKLADQAIINFKATCLADMKAHVQATLQISKAYDLPEGFPTADNFWTKVFEGEDVETRPIMGNKLTLIVKQ